MLDLINNPNLVITKMDPPLAFMASMWFYMTAANGHPSMHSSIVGNWVGYGKWTGAVFGPSSKLINNECNGESRTEGDMGSKAGVEIKSFLENFIHEMSFFTLFIRKDISIFTIFDENERQ